MEAQQILERALSKTEKICGRTHLGTLDTLLLLAWVYHKTNQLDEAERIYRRCLEGAERRLGQAQFDTLRVVRIVARFYFEQARYGESTALYERALAGEREQRCPNDVRALKLTHNLGVIFHRQNRFGEAKALFKEASKASAGLLDRSYPNELEYTGEELAIVVERMDRDDWNDFDADPWNPNNILAVVQSAEPTLESNTG